MLQDGEVVNRKLADRVVTTQKMQFCAVDENILAGSDTDDSVRAVSARHIKDGSLTLAKLSGPVPDAYIASGAVWSAHVASTANPHGVSRAQLGLATSDTPEFAGITLTDDLDMGTNDIVNAGSISASGDISIRNLDYTWPTYLPNVIKMLICTPGGVMSWGAIPVGGGGGTVSSVSGTPDVIVNNGTDADPILSIATTYMGQTSITTLGTVVTGVWHGTAIDDDYISSASDWNSHVSSTSNPHSVSKSQVGLGSVENTALSTWAGTAAITTLGTIATGTWEGSEISSDHTEAKVGSLSGTTDRIAVGGTETDPTIDIDSDYVGQDSITTLGTIATGVWQATTIGTAYTQAQIISVTGTANRLSVGGTGIDPTFDIASTYVGQTSITTLGTIVTGVWNAGAVTSSGDITATGKFIANGYVGSNWIPYTTDTYDLGSSTKLWRKGWLSELDTILFAQNTITLLGGWFIVGKGEGVLPTAVPSGDTTIDFGQAMTPGHFVEFRAALRMEYVQVGSVVSGTTYNVTRNLDGTDANDWPAGSVFLVLGADGDGRIELNSYDTPRLSIVTQGATYNAQSEWIRLGDLNGMPTYNTQHFGIYIGDGTNYLKYDKDSSVLTIAGSISILGGSGYANLSDKPSSLSGINSTEGTKLSGIAAGATVGATWGTNLSNIPATLGTPSGAGLYLASTHMGFYSGSAWTSAILDDGSGILASGAISWTTAGVLTVNRITATDGTIGGWTLGSNRIFGSFSGWGTNDGGMVLANAATYVSDHAYQQSSWGAVDAGFSIGGNSTLGAWIAHFGRVRDHDGSGNTTVASFTNWGIQFNQYDGSNYKPIFEISSAGGTFGTSVALIAGWNFDSTKLTTPTYPWITLDSANKTIELILDADSDQQARLLLGALRDTANPFDFDGSFGLQFMSEDAGGYDIFRMDSSGLWLNGSGVFSGAITASSGSITGSFLVQSTITVGDSTHTGIIQSSDYSAGTAGWKIGKGIAEFNGSAINGATITGGTIQTAAYGARIEIGVAGSAYLQIFDASGIAGGFYGNSGFVNVDGAFQWLGALGKKAQISSSEVQYYDGTDRTALSTLAQEGSIKCAAGHLYAYLSGGWRTVY